MILLEGDLVVRKISALKDQMLSELKEGELLSLGFKNLGEVDVTFLQLICSAHKYALKNGKQIAFEKPVPQELLEVIRNSGFTHLCQCGLPEKEKCLWGLLVEV